MAEKREKRFRIQFTKIDKVFLAVMVILAVLMSVVEIMRRFNLELINGGLYLYGAYIGLFVMLSWGAVAIFRKIKNKTARIIVGTLIAVVIFLLATIVGAYVGLVVNITIPREYSVVSNGSHQAVILRGYDADLERQEARREALLAENPESENTGWGYTYYAYPRVLGIFYRSNADASGEIYQDYENSQGQLMIEWPDEDTARLFIENPGETEGGEWILRFK